jgi:hypothetical protein
VAKEGRERRETMVRMGSFIFDGSGVSENVYMWLSVQVTGRIMRKIIVLRFG